MAYHVSRVQHVTDQHQAANDGANRGLLRCIDDACVLTTCCVEAKEIRILSKNHAVLSRREGQVLVIISFQHTCLLGGKNIFASVS